MNKKIRREYFFDDKTKTIYYAIEGTLDIGFAFMGTSDNPNPKMAAAVFARKGKVLTGCKIKEYSV
jgi:hypothetical protein